MKNGGSSPARKDGSKHLTCAHCKKQLGKDGQFDHLLHLQGRVVHPKCLDAFNKRRKTDENP